MFGLGDRAGPVAPRRSCVVGLITLLEPAHERTHKQLVGVKVNVGLTAKLSSPCRSSTRLVAAFFLCALSQTFFLDMRIVPLSSATSHHASTSRWFNSCTRFSTEWSQPVISLNSVFILTHNLEVSIEDCRDANNGRPQYAYSILQPTCTYRQPARHEVRE